MKRRQKRQKSDSGGGAESAAPADVPPPAPTLTVFETKELLMENMTESDILDELRAYLEKHLRLTGWRCHLKEECHDYIRERGPDNVNITHMASDLMPFALASVDDETRQELKNFIRMVAQELVTVDDSNPPPMETEESSTGEPYEYCQPRDTIPEPGTELLFTHQGPPPQNRHRATTPGQQSSSSPPHSSSNKGSLGGIVVVLDRIDLERENISTEKGEAFMKDGPIDVDEVEQKVESERQKEKERAEKEREKEKVEKEREKGKEKAEKEREKERLHKEKEKERLEKEKEQREREQKERDRHERQERHNLNLVNLSTSLPASPRSPSVRGDKKITAPEPPNTKHGGHSSRHQRERAAPEPIKSTGLASTLLTATAAIAGKKSKHINLNSDDDEDDDDDEELMDI